MKRLVSTLGLVVVGAAVALSVSVRSAPRRTQAGAAISAPAATSTARASETALDRYVAKPDPAFAWSVSTTLPAEGATATLIALTSQRWLTEAEVEQPVWKHSLVVVTPPTVTSDIGMLFIGGSRNDRPAPTAPAQWLVDLARQTGTVVAELQMVPNQPIVFKDDPAHQPRVEDDFIAYTWKHFLQTGDDRWPARLPMTKSAVRAMDAITAFAASAGGGNHKVSRFVVSGGSKRGWTTWTTAAVDRRVVAIAPFVIDVLNVEPSFDHHFRAYGRYSDAVKDYVDHGLLEWVGTPQFRALMKIEDPYEYRERLTMPKLLINAAGDQFFLPDSSRFYFDKLKAESHLRYVPNTDHSLGKSDALQTFQTFYASIVKGTPRPEFSWTFERNGAIKVVSKVRPQTVTLWRATNPEARNFRLESIGPVYQSTALTASGPNTWVGLVPPPTKGWTAFFVELTFATGETYPLKLTTAVRVLPDTLPFAAPVRQRPPGRVGLSR
jgi:PhoPQ-activated pathogenicity-related protein